MKTKRNRVQKVAVPESEDAALSKDYNLGSLFAFVFPSIFTFVFIALYQIVDGYFIEKFVGPYAIAAVNLYYPIISLLLAIGLMLGTGGNAVIVELIGEGKKEEADKVFSQVLTFAIVFGIIFAIVGIILTNPIMHLLGATDANIGYLKGYYIILTAFAPSIMLQTILGVLIIGEGRTVTTGVLTIVGGVVNIVFDYIFMKYCGWGTWGAAIATVMGYVMPVLYAFYFYAPNGPSKYHFRFMKIDVRPFLSLCYNGSSELVSNLAAGVTALFMNWMALKYFGEIGVSVVSVFLYVQFLIMAVFMGMTTAVEPLFSYHFGSHNVGMRKKIFKLSVILIAIFTVVIFAVMIFEYKPIVGIFFEPTGSDLPFYELACDCLFYSIPACLFVGFNIFASGMFTAFSNGTISALISGIRTFVALTICIFLLPVICGGNGLWYAWGAAELLSFVMCIFLVVKYNKVYYKEKSPDEG